VVQQQQQLLLLLLLLPGCGDSTQTTLSSHPTNIFQASYVSLQVSLAQQAPKPQAAPAAAVAAASASNPAGSLHEALAKSTPKFRTLLDVIKLTPANVPKNAVGTFFAPNDAVRSSAQGATHMSAVAC
jgi:hypothetical protein